MRREARGFDYHLAMFAVLFLMFFLIRSTGYGQASPWWASLMVGGLVFGAVRLVDRLMRDSQDQEP
jgi:hypothetical protein